jgi:hypothetical protein
MPPGLRGRDLLLNARLQQLRFGQGQTQNGDIFEIIWPDDLHDIRASRLTLCPLSTNRNAHLIIIPQPANS